VCKSVPKRIAVKTGKSILVNESIRAASLAGPGRDNPMLHASRQLSIRLFSRISLHRLVGAHTGASRLGLKFLAGNADIFRN
jgi:hypothetical protein